jgi:transposase
MSNRRNIMDIRGILNHIRAGSSNRQIAQDVKVDRRTVQRYRQWAQEQGLLEGPLPALGGVRASGSMVVRHVPP